MQEETKGCITLYKLNIRFGHIGYINIYIHIYIFTAFLGVGVLEAEGNLWRIVQSEAGIGHQGGRHVPALNFSFLCDVCDFIQLAYFTQCLQRCTLW